MGGRLSLIVAGRLGQRVSTPSSFHGGNIAAADDPDSPHRRAEAIPGTVYVAGATDDNSVPDEKRDRLERALTDAGVPHTIETYPAAHGSPARTTPPTIRPPPRDTGRRSPPCTGPHDQRIHPDHDRVADADPPPLPLQTCSYRRARRFHWPRLQRCPAASRQLRRDPVLRLPPSPCLSHARAVDRYVPHDGEVEHG